MHIIRIRNGSLLLSGLSILVMLSFSACISTELPEKALIGKSEVDHSAGLAGNLEENVAVLPQENEAWFTVLRGNQPVIITAPHATKPMREGKLRYNDGTATAALAAELHNLTGATAMYTTYASPSDPNYYDDNAFKEKLAALIEKIDPVIVLDIHGSHFNRPFDVDFGTMNGDALIGEKKLLINLVESFKKEGILNLSRDYFSASKNETITKWAVRHGVPCIQLEINVVWLNPGKDDLHAHNYAQLLQALARYISSLTEK